MKQPDLASLYRLNVYLGVLGFLMTMNIFMTLGSELCFRAARRNHLTPLSHSWMNLCLRHSRLFLKMTQISMLYPICIYTHCSFMIFLILFYMFLSFLTCSIVPHWSGTLQFALATSYVIAISLTLQQREPG